MRIISGVHKGRRLIPPKKLPVRPTTDRSKEALFNILQHQYDWSSLKVLDLFAGTGSISYEFASRGVTHIFAVDQNSMCIRFIQETSENLALGINTVQSDVIKYLNNIKIDFDLIFADPPYDITHESYIELIDIIFEKNQLKKEGMLIVEHSDQLKFEDHLQFSNSRKYGSNIFSFFKR
tara:strand:- start:167 stop:703 length:537 start_codon:yes stop_codon:yes gene_type:complete